MDIDSRGRPKTHGQVFYKLDDARYARGAYGYIVALEVPGKTVDPKTGKPIMSFCYLKYESYRAFKEDYNSMPKDKHCYEVIRYEDSRDSPARLFFDLDMEDKIYGSDFVHPNFKEDFERC